MSASEKVNDLSQSNFRKRFLEDKEHEPATRYCVAMGRVSIKKNKEKGGSDEAQLERIEEYIRCNNLILVQAWDVAETASKHDKRRNFKDLIRLVRDSQSTNMPIKRILFSHQSRSNRNRDSAKEIEYLVRHHGVFLVCIRDNLILHKDSSVEDWLRWDIFNVLNEKAVKDHTKNVVDGMIKALEEGRFPGKAPYGYKNYRPTEKSKSNIILDAPKDAYMTKAFELMATGRYTVERMKREVDIQFPQIQKKPKGKRLWELLRDPFYYGDIEFDGQMWKGKHPPLVSFELWQRVQDILNGRKKGKVSTYNFHYLNLIRCGGRLLNLDGTESEVLCDCAVTAEHKRRPLADGTVREHAYYRCSRNKPDGVCSQRDVVFMEAVAGRRISYTEAEIEILFEVVFRPLSFTPEVVKWMQDVLMKEHREKSGDHKQQVASLRRRHEMLQQYIDKAYDDKVGGVIDEGMWREKNAKWRVELEQTKRQIDALDDSKQEYMEKGVLLIELVQHTEKIYKNAKPEVKRKLVETISSNHVLRNGSIQFQYRKPFDILAKATPKEKWWR